MRANDDVKLLIGVGHEPVSLGRSRGGEIIVYANCTSGPTPIRPSIATSGLNVATLPRNGKGQS
jgi:hypothetical protein